MQYLKDDLHINWMIDYMSLLNQIKVWTKGEVIALLMLSLLKLNRL